MPRTLPDNGQLPRALYRAEQVRALDRAAIEQHGIPAATLMARAGAAAWRLLRARWPQAEAVTVLAGAGNNGGDGYVLARLALEQGLSVQVLTLGDHERLAGAAAEAAAAYTAAGGRSESFVRLPSRPGVIVDALLGTGLERPVSGPWAEAVAQANAAAAPVLALDIPSGLHADSGRVLGCAFAAAATISFVGLKRGLFTGRGPDHCGALRFASLGVPAAVYARTLPAARRMDWAKAQGLLPARRRCAHKGDFGHVLVVGGAPGMSGAPRLCGEAALRAGAGLVTVATHPEHAAWLNLGAPELMVHGVAEAGGFEAAAARADVLALGPGLGQAPWGEALWQRALARAGPLVVDADALNLLARSPRRRDDWVLTPHPGEAARLLGVSAAEVEADRFAAVERLQARYGGVAVLKGAGTLVHAGTPRPSALCTDGNPGMATAGAGDVLTGIIAALLGQGLGPGDAAEVGVCLHGAAGDRAAAEGARGLAARDLIVAVRAVLALAEAGS